MAGVPVSLMGLLFFLGLLSLCAARLARGESQDVWAKPLAFSMTLGGTAFVSYLTYVELFVIDAICVWCVATAIITAACFAATTWGAAYAAGARTAPGDRRPG
jgi:uncharacterized membrane protein